MSLALYLITSVHQTCYIPPSSLILYIQCPAELWFARNLLHTVKREKPGKPEFKFFTPQTIHVKNEGFEQNSPKRNEKVKKIMEFLDAQSELRTENTRNGTLEIKSNANPSNHTRVINTKESLAS